MWFYVQMWLPILSSRFDCCDLLQRSVIHHGAHKASMTIEA